MRMSCYKALTLSPTKTTLSFPQMFNPSTPKKRIWKTWGEKHENANLMHRLIHHKYQMKKHQWNQKK